MKNLTEGSEAKVIIAFAIPLFIGNLFQQLYSTIDAIIVGQFVSESALAAVGASFPIIFLMVSVVMGMSTGGGVLLSQYFGARDLVKFRRAMHTFYAVLYIASFIATIVGILTADPILRLVGTKAEYFDQARDFLQITFAGMFFVFGYNAIAAVLRSVGDSKRPLYFLIISSLVNIVLVLFFILVLKWGVAGSAFATVIAQAISYVVALMYNQGSKHEFLRVSFKELKIDKDELKKIFSQGIPGALQMGLVSLSYVVLIGIINPFGLNVMAGYTAAGRLDSFAILPAMNLSIAISTFVGQNLGAKKMDRVSNGLKAGLWIGGGISVVISALLVIIPRELIMMFNSTQPVIAAGADYLWIVAPFYIVFATMFTYMGVLRGAGAGTYSMVSTTVAVWVARIPAALILSTFLGPNGIWWGIPIGWVIGMIMVMVYYHLGLWKKRSLVD